MDKSASRRSFLQHITALGALGSASTGLAASDARAAESRQTAQAQPGAASARRREHPRPLERVAYRESN